MAEEPDQGQRRDEAASLRLERLSKHFDDVVAVDDISLDIARGEFLTLLGPSGSGKTTTLMMIAGFEEPTAGSIEFEGRLLNDVASFRRGFGMVFQSYALFPHMTVTDNVAFPLRMRRVSNRERADLVEQALDLVRLPGHGDRYPNQLSGGQQQRIALARALVFNPPVLLMDEPLGALDKKLREEMQLEIKRIQEQVGITTIYVTHDQEEALVMSDRIAVMNHGRIEQLDTPGNLYERPKTSFVADFIGESNILPIKLTQSNGEVSGEFFEGTLLRLPEVHDRVLDQITSIVVRPEKMQFVDGDRVLDNILDGTVREVIYIGDVTKYRIEIPGDLTVTLTQQNRSGQSSFTAGQTVSFGWSVEDGSLV